MVGSEPTGCNTLTHYPGSHIWELIGHNLVGILAGAEPPYAPCESSVPTSSKSSDETIAAYSFTSTDTGWSWTPPTLLPGPREGRDRSSSITSFCRDKVGQDFHSRRGYCGHQLVRSQPSAMVGPFGDSFGSVLLLAGFVVSTP
jgi:hypothetical protein